MKNQLLSLAAALLGLLACEAPTNPNALKPDFVTSPTLTDTDDPAIWIHPEDPMQSLILGTDKGDENGGIYVFDLKGNEIKDKTVTGLKRPNNVDVAYSLALPDSQSVDIAVYTERGLDKIRVLSLPDMAFLDEGGIPVFEGEAERAPMGVAMYTRPSTGEIFAIVSRKTGPSGNYLWQYRLSADSTGRVSGEVVRKFGRFEGGKEIEAIAVDNELGYVYYSDEGAGVRKYYADPDSSNQELAFFDQEDFADDHEGISIYTQPGGKGYILVSDQQANRFHVFTREGSPGNPHAHRRLAIIPMSTLASDGSEATSTAFGDLYPRGFFVAMSDDRTFQIYRWEKLEESMLRGQGKGE